MTTIAALTDQGLIDARRALEDVRRNLVAQMPRAEAALGEAEANLNMLRKQKGFVDLMDETLRDEQAVRAAAAKATT